MYIDIYIYTTMYVIVDVDIYIHYLLYDVMLQRLHYITYNHKYLRTCMYVYNIYIYIYLYVTRVYVYI